MVFERENVGRFSVIWETCSHPGLLSPSPRVLPTNPQWGNCAAVQGCTENHAHNSCLENHSQVPPNCLRTKQSGEGEEKGGREGRVKGGRGHDRQARVSAKHAWSRPTSILDVSSSTLKMSPRPYSSLFIFFELRKNYLFYFQLELTFDTILYQFQMYSTALRSLYNLRSDPRFGLMPT